MCVPIYRSAFYFNMGGSRSLPLLYLPVTSLICKHLIINNSKIISLPPGYLFFTSCLGIF